MKKLLFVILFAAMQNSLLSPIGLQSATLMQKVKQEVSKENFELIKTDMSLQEVEKYLGKGELKSEAGEGANKVQVYLWTKKGFFKVKTISCSFQGGKLVAKAQQNL